MIKTVVFDMDDTLYDEIEYCESGFKAVAEFLAGKSKMPDAGQIFNALWTQFTAGNRQKTFNTALDELKITYDDNFIKQLINIYRDHDPQISLPQESEDVLRRLAEKYTLALLTDGFLPAQQLKVGALGIEKFFKCIIYNEQFGRESWKPSPAGFQKIIDILNANPQTTCYIGDNEKKDFIAPNRLGFFTVQLIRPARLHTKLHPESDGKAQHVIQQISQLPELLKKL